MAEFAVVTASELSAMEFPPRAPEPPTVPTWTALAALEPRLLDVERQALRLHPRAKVDDWKAWSTIKAAMMGLVGWSAERFELRTSTAYDVAYDHLFDVWEHGRKAVARKAQQ